MSAPPQPPVRTQPTASPGRSRAAWFAALAAGTDELYEPRREDCPWCGSHRLRTRLRTGDLRHRTPGRFTVDACRDCGHTFQNPRLTAQGLALHHGVPGPGLPAARRHHRSAAHAVRLRCPEPESWLDVGTGHADFPATAREVFPYTSFDGLDPTPRVERARAAERVEEAFVGRLTDPHIRTLLRARYDVVSLLHQLEHAPDPRAELRAALHVLRPGGHLLVETTDPGSLFAALLGRWWPPYDQPRRPHLPTPANLCAELRAQGCTVLAVDRAGHLPHDLAGALGTALSHALPAPDTPWRATPPTPLQRRLRQALLRAAVPPVAAAGAADRALAPLARHSRLANTCRILARKDTASPPGLPRQTPTP
ncbi:class I SAM-dependent methyltransferase [Streptomyces leeuwenhoekii]|uniref:class I SAM-dependent methyltransferase n=1 Tax=Streptomyces leeuwenhoekii TaxID=1437453 RepID=UPI0037007030